MDQNLGNVRFLTSLIDEFDHFFNHPEEQTEEIKRHLLNDLISKTKILDDTKESKYEALIVTVIDVEFEMLKNVFSLSDFPFYKDKNIELFAASTTTVSNEHNIVVAKIGKAGNIYATLLTERILTKFEFRIAILCGIAAGLRGQIELGDALVSGSVYYYELEKLKSVDRVDRADFIQSRDQIKSFILGLPSNFDNGQSAFINQIYKSKRKYQSAHLKYKKKEGQYQKSNGKPIEDKKARKQIREFYPSLKTDKDYWILSGEKLLADGKKIKELSEKHDYFIVSEMEAAGFAMACRSNDVDWIIIRGITDFGDEFKNDTFHYSASLSAAVAAKLTLEKFLIDTSFSR